MVVGVQTCTPTVEISATILQLAGNDSSSRPNCSTFGHFHKGRFILPERHVLSHACCCSIHDGQRSKLAMMSLNRRIEKKVVHFFQRSISQQLKRIKS